MTMHMLPPMYSTTGKKKGKQKFRTAEQANQARKNAASWNELLEKYDAKVVVEQPKSVPQRKGDFQVLSNEQEFWDHLCILDLNNPFQQHRLKNDKVWLTRERVEFTIAEMKTSHIQNCIAI